MGLIVFVLIIAFALYFTGQKIPAFKEFCNKYGGVVIFLLASWQLINFESAMGGARRTPSFLPMYLVIAYALLYRMDVFKLVGLRRAHPSEELGWKFMATLSTGILLPSLYFSIQNTIIVAPLAIFVWFVIFFTTVEIQKEKNFSYFSIKKMWLPSIFGIIASGIYLYFVK